MSGYTKLFNSILASTIWREDDKTRIVWITLLAMKDKNGIAECSIPGLAGFANVSLEDCEMALQKLMSPDKYSRTKEHDGRRIEEIPGGFLILNHHVYRERMGEDERREYNRQKQAEHRAKKAASNPVNDSSMTVNDSHRLSALSAHTKAETETDSDSEANAYTESTKKNTPKTPQAAADGDFSLGSGKEDSGKKEKREVFKQPSFEEAQDFGKEIGLTDAESAYIYEFYESKGWMVGKTKMRSWKAAWRTAKLGWDFGNVNKEANGKPAAPAKKVGVDFTLDAEEQAMLDEYTKGCAANRTPESEAAWQKLLKGKQQ